MCTIIHAQKNIRIIQTDNKQTLASVHRLQRGHEGHVDKENRGNKSTEPSVYIEEIQTFGHTLSDYTDPEGNSSPR